MTSRSGGKSASALAAVVVAVAVAGFFTGTRAGGTRAELDRAPFAAGSRSATEAPRSGRAPSYGELRAVDRRGNEGVYAMAPAILAAGLPAQDAPVTQGPEDRARALADRQVRRAYDGAPPTIPHGIDQGTPSGCLVCHERGAVIQGRTAPAISHARLANCTQCHVAASPLSPSAGAPRSEPSRSTFEGHAWGPGERAWPGAPPTIPHPTAMRAECGSCHGVSGRLGLRSTHVWRANCLQCHAGRADLDQRAAVAVGAVP
ncbi:MAG: hypothetical protein U0169_02225 [Polyangiaceae bacterium]